MNYYKVPNRFTEINKEKWIISELKFDLDFIFTCVKSILIHPIDARKQKVKYDHLKTKLFHAMNTTVDAILAYPGLIEGLKNKKLPLVTCPQDKAVLSCDHHALLFTSMVRYTGNNIRVKTGYAKYLVPNTLIPHWITEIYDDNKKKWNLVDPEQLIKNVDKNDFIFAHEAWIQYFENNQMEFTAYSGLKELQGIKYALFCELNCLFKNELLGYEWRVKSFNTKKPEIVNKSYERLSIEQKNDIHLIAQLLKKPDDNLSRLYEYYIKHGIDSEMNIPEL